MKTLTQSRGTLHHTVGGVERQKCHEKNKENAESKTGLLDGPRHRQQTCAHHRIPDGKAKRYNAKFLVENMHNDLNLKKHRKSMLIYQKEFSKISKKNLIQNTE